MSVLTIDHEMLLGGWNSFNGIEDNMIDFLQVRPLLVPSGWMLILSDVVGGNANSITLSIDNS